MITKRLAVAMMVGVLLTATAAAAQPLTPHYPGWARLFDITAEPFQQGSRPMLSGYVVSKWGETATGVRLLVESVDARGAIVGQRVEWLSGTVPPFSRAYFEVPAPAPAASYRVSVFTFDFPQAARAEAP